MVDATDRTVPATVDAESRKGLPSLAFLDTMAQMPALRQVALLIGLAASVAIGFAVVLWSQEPDYRPLYANLNNLDASQVIETLNQSGIKFKLEPNSGALLVKANDLAAARLKLATAGVAPTDNTVGYEIMDKDQGLGTSQFMETTRYRRGLEGELARTIASLQNVKSARVH